jgi:hypothetical protein
MPLPPPTKIRRTPLGQQESDKDQYHRQRKAYKWYKQHAKPTKERMYSIVDHYASDNDITRQDVDLLPWNREETEVNKKVMKALKALKKRIKTEKVMKALEALKKRIKTEKKDKKREEKRKKKDQEEKEHGGRESIVSKVEEDHTRKREERRRKREEAKKSIPEINVHNKNTASDGLEGFLDTGKKKKKKKGYGSASVGGSVGGDASSGLNGFLDTSIKKKEKKGFGSASVGGNASGDFVGFGVKKSNEASGSTGISGETPIKSESTPTTSNTEGEICIRADGKRVPRIKKNAGSTATTNDSKGKSLSGVLESGASSFPKRSGSAEDTRSEVKEARRRLDRAFLWYKDQEKKEHGGRESIVSKVEEEHTRKREERRLKREAAKKSMPEIDVHDKKTAEDTRSEVKGARQNNRLERAFLWYIRMGTPTCAEFKRQIASQKVDITTKDVDLLAWNEKGTRVVNITAMNAMIMTKMLKQSATRVLAH